MGRLRLMGGFEGDGMVWTVPHRRSTSLSRGDASQGTATQVVASPCARSNCYPFSPVGLIR